MKKITILIVALLLVLSALAGCAGVSPSADPVSVATMAGPAGIGMISLFSNSDYDVSLFTAPEQLSPKIINGEVDVAAVPGNLAAVLYNKMEGGLRIIGVNTMGVLYILENGDSIHSLSDLAGKTIYATGQGATPEYVLEKVLAENGLADVNVEYMAVHADLANALAAGEVSIALLPEPFVSTVLAKNSDVSVKIDINQEWQAIFGPGTGIPMGVTVVSEAFAQDDAAMSRLIEDYSASVAFVNSDIDAAAAAIADQKIVPSAAIAAAAIPRCEISLITGQQCKDILSDYFEVMLQSDPKSIGGALPDDDIYYMP